MEYHELIESFATKHGMDGLEIIDGVAALDIDGMRIAFIDDESTRSIVLLGEIGAPPHGDGGRLGSLLMQANYLFRGTNGATFAQNPETGAYAIVRSLPLAPLDATALADALETFANTLERWRRVAAETLPDGRPTDAPRAPSGGDLPFGAPGFLSV